MLPSRSGAAREVRVNPTVQVFPGFSKKLCWTKHIKGQTVSRLKVFAFCMAKEGECCGGCNKPLGYSTNQVGVLRYMDENIFSNVRITRVVVPDVVCNHVV